MIKIDPVEKILGKDFDSYSMNEHALDMASIGHSHNEIFKILRKEWKDSDKEIHDAIKNAINLFKK